MRIGILTGGGDAPGLNAVIRGIVRKAANEGHQCVGFRKGWAGIRDAEGFEMGLDEVAGILHRGGTILKSSRTNLAKEPNGIEKAKETFKKYKLDALIAIGGEDTLGVANTLFKNGLNVVGVPKTIDNDLSGTDSTFGFDTAVSIATEAIDRLHTTAESHDRVIVVEVMGRHAGWIALQSGVAGGADVVLIPEFPFDADEVAATLKRRHTTRKKDFSVVVVAEGAKMTGKEVLQDQELDAFGHVKLGGIGETLAKILKQKTGYDTRHVVLGHTQRGGTPTAFDRWLGLRYGVKAAELAIDKDFGKMAALKGTEIIGIPLEEGVKELKVVQPELYEFAKTFFG